jgi:hypothetical protein
LGTGFLPRYYRSYMRNWRIISNILCEEFMSIEVEASVIKNCNRPKFPRVFEWKDENDLKCSGYNNQGERYWFLSQRLKRKIANEDNFLVCNNEECVFYKQAAILILAGRGGVDLPQPDGEVVHNQPDIDITHQILTEGTDQRINAGKREVAVNNQLEI